MVCLEDMKYGNAKPTHLCPHPLANWWNPEQFMRECNWIMDIREYVKNYFIKYNIGAISNLGSCDFMVYLEEIKYRIWG